MSLEDGILGNESNKGYCMEEARCVLEVEIKQDHWSELMKKRADPEEHEPLFINPAIRTWDFDFAYLYPYHQPLVSNSYQFYSHPQYHLHASPTLHHSYHCSR